ncbi:MAG: serine hydrolase [Luteitalea sp.]|nr:serine hydrolase [Luteitalea sp.]
MGRDGLRGHQPLVSRARPVSSIAPRAHRYVTLALVLSCALTALAGAAPQNDTSHPAVPPPTGSASGPPALTEARKAASELKQLHSLLVSWRGDIVLEHYASGVTAGKLANIKSASKSVIAALVGIALDRGLIASVAEPIVTFFPELGRDADERKRTITVEHLLTMQSGLESTSGEHYGPWVRSRNWVRYALERPLVSAPGTSMEYSTGTSHMLSALLTKVAKKSTREFAQEVLAGPLGFTLARWPRDPQGIYFGGNQMLMTPRQMVAFGELYRNRGEVGGRQILSAEWIDASCVPRTRSRWDSDRLYGYGWWVQQFGDWQACFAWGFGGQYVFVFRDLALVIAVTSSTNASDERFGYRRSLFELIEREVLPAVATATSAGVRGSP